MNSADAKTVAVTGATGFVGRHVVRALLDTGHAVRTLVRDRDKARDTLPRGTAQVVGDAEDRRTLADLAAECDAVVNCIGIRREFPPEVTFERVHVRCARAVVEASKAAGARRLVQISALGTRPNATTAYHRSKYEGERLVRESGLEWTILRPSLIHGPGGEFMKMAKDWAMGRAAPFVFMPYFARGGPGNGFPPIPRPESAMVQPVHVEDVAAAVVAALREPAASGEIYPLAGPETLDWPTLLAIVRDALPLADRKKRIVPLPGVLASAAARAAEAVGLGAALPFGPSEPIMAIEDNTAALDKAREHLGLRPRAYSAAVRAYARQI
jgi:NADH dehydrogenase